MKWYLICALLALAATQFAGIGVGVSSMAEKPAVQLAPAHAHSASRSGDAERPDLGSEVTEEAEPIVSDVSRDGLLVPAGGTGSIPASGAPDVVGAFRFICMPGQLSYDDPIIFHGQPGKSHLHQFFGNTRADASSSYASLRRTGDSTCMNHLNRSAYWIPAMLDGQGHVVRPDYVSIYYKRLPSSSPDCRRQGDRCAPIPRGLRFVFGFDMVTGKAKTGAGYFNCDGAGAEPGHYSSIPAAAVHCPSGAHLGAVISAPDCWDGRRLDSPNHRDHMAYAAYGGWGYLRCPRSHPIVIPTFTLGAWYTTDNSLRRDGSASWHLSSDEMPGMTMPPGSTLHADWFGAWDDATMADWTTHCIERLLSCSAGDLGNGKQLRQVTPFSWTAAPRLVPTPPRPSIVQNR